MRVLVTGGGGFIGSHVAESLLAANHAVRIVDRQPAHRVRGAELWQTDLNQPGVAARAVEGIDAVCHQAAKVGLGIDFSDAPGYVADNDLASATLLAALSARGFRGRLVLASSMVVYGDGRYHCSTHGSVRPGPRRRSDLDAGRFDPACPMCGEALSWVLIDEDAPLEPRSIYAASKLAQEHLCNVWAHETGASVIALRYHNVYGPRLPLDTPYAGVAALFRSWLRNHQAPLVFEDGLQTRDFVHVHDVARANVTALDAAAAVVEPGGHLALNVCSGRPVTIQQVVESLADAFGADAPRPVVTGRYRLGDVRHVVASPARAKSMLGFSARVPLELGLAELALETGAGRS